MFMKMFHLLFLSLLALNINACNKDDEIGDSDELDIQREEEYQTDDIRDHELDLDN